MFKRVLVIMAVVIMTVVSTGCSSSSSGSSSSSSTCAKSGCSNTPKFGSSFCSAHQDVADAVRNGYFN